jgi:hypothetical protein
LPLLLPLTLPDSALTFTFSDEEAAGVWDEVDEDDEVPVNLNMSS